LKVTEAFVPVSVRFSVAVHLLVFLAVSEDPVPSGLLAASVSTNPVVIRRLLGALRRAGLVRATPGPRGGFSLARRPASISLDRVYRLVEDRGAAPRSHRPSSRCPVGRNVSEVLEGIGRHAERGFLRALSGRTVETAVREVRRRARASRR
jgi:Rrf2 family protein